MLYLNPNLHGTMMVYCEVDYAIYEVLYRIKSKFQNRNHLQFSIQSINSSKPSKSKSTSTSSTWV